MYIIVGLGNPGREYQNTRHNVGFMTLDILADRLNIEIKRHNFRAVFGEGYIGGTKVVLAKPETYMNLSGWSVMDLCNWYKPEHDQLIVIYDDIDIPLGTIRIRGNGSAGTHNGMRNIVYQLGYDDFPRIRVGIGRTDGERTLVSHVLGAPEGEERELLIKAMKDAADAAELIVRGDLKEAQARYNKKPKKEKKPKEQPGDSQEKTQPETTSAPEEA